MGGRQQALLRGFPGQVQPLGGAALPRQMRCGELLLPCRPCWPLPQVGTEGEEAAAQYLLGEVTKLAEQAAKDRPDLLVEAAREQVGRETSWAPWDGVISTRTLPRDARAEDMRWRGGMQLAVCPS